MIRYCALFDTRCVGGKVSSFRKRTHLSVLLVVEAGQKKKKERVCFYFAAPFYMTLWSRHIVAIRGTIWNARDAMPTVCLLSNNCYCRAGDFGQSMLINLGRKIGKSSF